jgi:DNA-binding transcriptional regulator GbsR (MarR family)
VSADAVLPTDVRSMTPSAKTVYQFLQLADGAKTIDEVASGTGLSDRSVEKALSTLADHDRVSARPDPAEPRRHLWSSDN